MTDTLIWAAALFIPLMTLVLWLAPSFRRAIDAVAAANTASTAERDVGVQAALADVAERRHQLALRAGLLDEETLAERTRLAADTAKYETDRKAAENVLDAAEAGRREVLAARAEAEAALAPEAARKALEGGEDLSFLGDAYAEFTRQYGYSEMPTFGQWIGNFRGLGR